MHMARPPATIAAPNALAAYMRAFRAWKAGRGDKPVGRVAFVAEHEAAALGAELEEAEMWRSVEAHDNGDSREVGWAELRDAILDLGGIRPNADYGHLGIPAPIYRRDGVAADLMAELLADYHHMYFDGDAGLLAECWHRFDSVKRHREAA